MPPNTPPSEPDDLHISRRAALKAGAIAVGGSMLPLAATPLPAITPVLSATSAKGALSFLKNLIVNQGLLGESVALEGFYDAWTEEIDDPLFTNMMQEMMQKAGLIRPGEPVTHATWKRLIHQRVKDEAARQLLTEKIERDFQKLKAASQCEHLASLLRAPGERIMNLLYGIIEKRQAEVIE